MSRGEAFRLYFVRRLFYNGSVRNRDLQEAFKLSARTAQRRLNDLRDEFSHLVDPCSANVIKCLEKVRVNPHDLSSVAPKSAQYVDATRMLNEFWLPAFDPWHFGADSADANHQFVDNAVHYMVNHLGATQLPPEVDYTELVQAMIEVRAICVRYVSMQMGAQSKDRTIFPMILRVIGDQFVVSAYDVKDLESANVDRQPPLKTFVLFRMLEIQRVRQTEQFLRFSELIDSFPSGRERFQSYKITLNKAFTVDQKTVIRRELGLSANDYKKLDSALLFQFKAQYMVGRDFSAMQSKNNVWPIVEAIEEV